VVARAASLRLAMPVPRIAIVGRPNVGKSSLLNMIAGAKVSIVDPTPGVTRDRVSVVVDLPSPDGSEPARAVEFVDTGGFGVYAAEGARYDEVGADLSRLTPEIEKQIGEAVASADLVLFAVDVQAGVTPQDEEIGRMLREGRFVSRRTERRLTRRRGGAEGGGGEGEEASDSVTPSLPRSVASPRVRVVATKVDGPSWESHAHELASLGFGGPLMVSAKSNYFRRDFLDALYGMLPPATEDAAPPPADLRVAIIGKRNSGKSSLVNALAGEPRVIVSEIAGTTRDAVDVRFEMDGRAIVAIDTAGLRRKRSFQGQVEWYAFDRAKRAVERADVVLLLIDATEPVSQVDQQLAMLAQKAYKPVVIVVNKWDLAEGRQGPKGRRVTTEDYEEYLRRELKGLAFAPIAFASATEGRNLRGLIDVAFDLHQQAGRRVTTGELNRLVRGILDTRGPTSKVGTRVKLFYVAQVRTNPPTIALVVNHPELFTANYERFLLNRFREELPFEEVPIRLLVRARKRGERTEEPGESAVDAAVEARADAAEWFEDE